MWTFEEASHFVRELNKTVEPFGYQPALAGECLFKGITTGALEVAIILRPGSVKNAVTQAKGAAEALQTRFELTPSPDPLERLAAFHTDIGDRKLRLLVPSTLKSLFKTKLAPTTKVVGSVTIKLPPKNSPKPDAFWDIISGLAGQQCGEGIPSHMPVPGCGAIHKDGDSFYWLSHGPKNYWHICEACANKAGVFKPSDDVDITTAQPFAFFGDDYGTWALTKAAVAKGLKFVKSVSHPKVTLDEGAFWSLVIGLANSSCQSCEGTYIKHAPVFNQGGGMSNYICTACAAHHGYFPPFVKV